MTVLMWLVAQLNPGAPGFWLAVDLLFALGLQVAGAWFPMAHHRLLRALRWTLVPYLALLAGALSPEWMGIAGVDWQIGLTLGLGFVVVMLALLGLTRLSVFELRDRAAHQPVQPLSVSLAAGLEQFHWVFQRGALLFLLPTWPAPLESAAYWAIWIATVLAVPGVFVKRQGVVRLYALVALVSTAILFFYTRNFWLCWMLHAGVMLIGGATSTGQERPNRPLLPPQTETDTVARARPVEEPRPR